MLTRYDSQAVEAALSSSDPAQQLLLYLDALIQIVAAASGEPRDQLLTDLRESVRTAEGGPILDVRVQLSPAQSALYNDDVISLPDHPGLRQLASELAKIRDDIAREIEPPTRRL